MSSGPPGTTRRDVCVEGVRFALHRSDPPAGGASGPPVLLLHGVPETAATWAPLVAALSADRVLLAPDLKGLGDSEVVGPYDVGSLVRELVALVLHEVDGPVDVVGHDWGGSLAIALCGARPDLVRRLVVLNAPFRYLDLARGAHIPLLDLPVLPEAAFALGGRWLVGAAYRHGWKADRPVAADLLAGYRRAYGQRARAAALLAYYRTNTRRLLLPMLAATVRPSLLARRPPPRVGTERNLVVWGAADPVLPVRVGESVTRDLGARTTMVTLPGVGHWPLEECPEVVVPTITAFLAEQASPAPPPVPEELDLDPETEPESEPDRVRWS